MNHSKIEELATGDSTAQAMLTIFDECLRVKLSRQDARKDVWRRSGARGMAMHVFAKAERVFRAVMEGEQGWARVVEDEVPDIINYAAFLLIQAGEGELDGDWPWPE